MWSLCWYFQKYIHFWSAIKNLKCLKTHLHIFEILWNLDKTIVEGIFVDCRAKRNRKYIRNVLNISKHTFHFRETWEIFQITVKVDRSSLLPQMRQKSSKITSLRIWISAASNLVISIRQHGFGYFFHNWKHKQYSRFIVKINLLNRNKSNK